MRALRYLGLLLVAALSLTILPSCTAADEARLADLMNAERRRAGVPALHVDSRASDLARDWSATMARQHRLYHNPNLAGQITRRVGGGWRAIGENVAHNTSADGAHHSFMRSGPHRANILNRAYNRVGVGVVNKDNRLWVTVVFIGY